MESILQISRSVELKMWLVLLCPQIYNLLENQPEEYKHLGIIKEFWEESFLVYPNLE